MLYTFLVADENADDNKNVRNGIGLIPERGKHKKDVTDEKSEEDEEANEMSPNVHCLIVEVKEALYTSKKVKVGTVPSADVGVGLLHGKETQLNNIALPQSKHFAPKYKLNIAQ
jgi:hypothetical protein